VTAAATLLNSRYRLEERIGAGGFCEVWRATDTVLTRPAAVKLLHPGFAYQPEARARFRAEARHAGALSHQNIAQVYDYGEPACGQSYLLLTPEGAVRITDFGIAHAVGSAPLTATGMVLGTPGYLAPERVAGAQGGPASDLYALGIVAFECLTGARPFSGPPLVVALAHRDRPLPPLPASLPAEVADFVMVLTAKDPAWRPASAAEVADQARWLYGRLVCGAIRARPARSRAPLAIAGAAICPP
jgi:serine/threonine-protein kinase